MKVAAFFGKKDIRLVDLGEPVAGMDSVVMKVCACGICGTDVHAFNSDFLTGSVTTVIDGYRVIGHEFAGEIVGVGQNVAGWQVGDRVASVHNRGGMAEYVHIPGDRLKDLYRIPTHLPYATAATLEPFCVSVHAFHLRPPADGETVAIFGCGVIGLGYLQAVKAYTRARTITVDVSPLRLETARKLGADVALNAREVDPVREIKKLTGERPMRHHKTSAGACDIAVECSGKPAVLNQALEVLKPANGTVIVAGVYSDILPPIDPNILMVKNLTLFGSQGFTGAEVEESLRLMTSGQVQRDLLVSHTFPLEHAQEAFQVQSDPAVSVKVVVVN